MNTLQPTGLRVETSTEELREHLLARAAYHAKQADLLKTFGGTAIASVEQALQKGNRFSFLANHLARAASGRRGYPEPGVSGVSYRADHEPTGPDLRLAFVACAAALMYFAYWANHL